MPDWISHILVALIIGQLFSIRKKSLLVLGAILPDILGKSKLLNLFFDDIPFIVTMISGYGHMVFPSLLVAMFIALFFIYPYFKTFLIIAIGDISHFLADGTSKSFTYNGYLPVLWHDQYYIFLISALLIYALLKKFNIRFYEWREKNENTVKIS